MDKRFFISFLVFLFVNLSVFSTIYYVSNDGKDTNNGTNFDTPFRTLLKVSSLDLNPGDQVLLKRGDAFIDPMIISSSGTITNPIYYGAYGVGEKPIISGFQSINNWENHGNGIYKSYLGISNLNILTINNKIAQKGRYPNEGLLSYESVDKIYSITDNELSHSPNWTNAEIVIRKNGWTYDRNKIIQHSGNTIYYDNSKASKYEPRLGDTYGYFIQDDIKTLDRFGEWYYDGQYLYVYFGDNSPQNHTVKVAKHDYLIYLYRKGGVVIENLKLEGSNKSSFFADILSGIKIINCEINFSADNGVVIQGFGEDVIVSNNNIFNTQGQALSIGVLGRINNSVIKNNKIINSGMLPGMGGETCHYGAIFSRGISNIIEYNHIEESGYIGIKFLLDNTIVRNNYVYKSNQFLFDGGAIYTWFNGDVSHSQNGMKIHNNIVVSSGSIGIYSDGNTNGLEVIGNSVFNCETFGIKMNQPRNNILESNNLFGNKIASIDITNLIDADLNSKDNSIRNNIIFSNNSISLFKLRDGRSQEIFNFGTSNNNFLIIPNSDYFVLESFSKDVINNRWIVTSENLSTWQNERGFDKNSKIIFNNEPVLVKYNNSKEIIQIPLQGSFLDAKGNRYTNFLEIQPYSSKILISDKDPIILNTAPNINDQTFNVETVSQGAFIVARIFANDPDEGQSLNYKIISGNNQGLFWLSPTTGNLYTVQSYDGVSDLTSVLEVEVTDNGNPIKSARAIITINNKGLSNSLPIINNQTFEVETVSAGAFIVARIVASDPDDGQSLNYRILTGNNGLFWLSPTSGNLFTVPGYDGFSDLSSVLEVEVTDNGNPVKTSRGIITINHKITNNEAPIFNDQTFIIETVSPGAFIVARIFASDPDQGQSLNYQILSGNSKGLFWLSPTTGNLYTVPSYDGTSNLNSVLEVEVSDNGNPVKASRGVITLNHSIVSNTAPIINNQTFEFGAVSQGAFIVARILASDADEGQSLNYRILSGNNKGLFWLSPTTGNLYTVPNYDGFLDLSSVLEVEVADNGNPVKASRGMITLNHRITNNTAPIINNQTFNVETVSSGAFIVARIFASDPDKMQSLNYRILSGNNGLFWLSPTTGNLYTVPSYDGVSNLSSVLEVEVSYSNSSSLSSRANIIIMHTVNKSSKLGGSGSSNEIQIQEADPLLDNESLDINVYPNPFRTELTVSLLNVKQGNRTITSILDVTGKVVDVYEHMGSSIDQKISINSIDKAGIYFIRVVSGDEVVTRRVMKID